MSQENIIPAEAIGKLLQPPTRGEIVYAVNGVTHKLRVLPLGDGVQLFRSNDRNPEGFNVIILNGGEIITNEDTPDARNEVESIFGDIRELATLKGI